MPGFSVQSRGDQFQEKEKPVWITSQPQLAKKNYLKSKGELSPAVHASDNRVCEKECGGVSAVSANKTRTSFLPFHFQNQS